MDWTREGVVTPSFDATLDEDILLCAALDEDKLDGTDEDALLCAALDEVGNFGGILIDPTTVGLRDDNDTSSVVLNKSTPFISTSIFASGYFALWIYPFKTS